MDLNWSCLKFHSVHDPTSMKQLVIFGEIFWDRFQNGSVRMGGSALNIAWHLKGLGLEPYFVSRIGNDELGQKLKSNIQSWGLVTHFLQIDSSQPTGVIEVLLDENQKPTFISPDKAALDYIQEDSKISSLSSSTIFYHGSFILRNAVSNQTVRTYKDKGFSIFMDFNLRDPYWNQSLVDQWVRDLYFFKLSDDESVHLTKKKGLSGREQVEWLQEWMPQRNIENILFTLGEKGSFWITQTGIQFEPARKISVVNSVGAGDAYVAGILYSVVKGFTSVQAMKYSSLLASEICKIDSATSPEKDFYQQFPEEV